MTWTQHLFLSTTHIHQMLCIKFQETYENCVLLGSQVDLSSIVTRLWTWMMQSSNYGRSKRFFSSQVQGDWLWHPPSLLLSGDWGSFMGVNQPKHEGDHSFPSRPKL